MKIQLKYANELNLVLYSTLFKKTIGHKLSLYWILQNNEFSNLCHKNNTCITKLYNIHKMCTMECHDVQQNIIPSLTKITSRNLFKNPNLCHLIGN
jgi:hypothetical protein